MREFNPKLIERTPGIYVVRCLKGNRPRKFRRLNGTDKQGILCIGKSVNLRNRIRAFYNDIHKNGLEVKYHSEGWNYRKYFRDSHNPSKLKISPIDMEFLWKNVRTGKTADDTETRLIQEYVVKFQDKPPLNISIKRQRM